MRLAALVCLLPLVLPAGAQTKEDITMAYAYVVGTAPNCGIPINLAKAGQYSTEFDLDPAEVGKQMWEAAQMVSQLDGQALDDWCGTVADSVVELGLQP